MQTMQQQRAQFALEGVQKALAEFRKNHLPEANDKSKEPKACKEFRAYASEFPFMIHTNGLGQAAAFFLSKSKDKDSTPHGKLYQLLSDWLTQKQQPFAGKKDLMDGITKNNMHTYRAAQVEAMLFMQWVKQFATAFVASD